MTRADKMEALHAALKSDNLEEFVRLLALYPDCRRNGGGTDGWMRSAAWDGKLWAVEILVEQGAKVDLPIDPTGVSPNWPIEYAALSGNVELVRYMLDRGAQPNHTVRGEVNGEALIAAAEEGHLEIAQLLVERGAEVNALRMRGTALDFADGYGHAEVAAYLRSVGGKTYAELKGIPPKAPKPRQFQLPQRVAECRSAVEGAPLGQWRTLFESNLPPAGQREYGTEYEFGVPAMAEELAKIEKTLKVQLPVGVREMLSEFNGIWDTSRASREQKREPNIAFLDAQHMAVEVPGYLADTDNPLPPKKSLRQVVWVAQSNGFGDLWGVCVTNIGKHLPAGTVVRLDHEVGKLKASHASLSEFVHAGRHGESK